MDQIQGESISRRGMIAGLAAAGAVLGAAGGPAKAADYVFVPMSPSLATGTASDWSAYLGQSFAAYRYSGALKLVKVETTPASAVYGRTPFTVTFEATAGTLDSDRIVRLTDPKGRVLDLYLGPCFAAGRTIRLVGAFS